MQIQLPAMRCAIAAAMLSGSAFSSAAADYFRDKTISIITSTGAGGAYDNAARAIARHMPKYIPGKPAMVVKNMPGGGHTRATNFLYTTAPQDGTTIGTVSNTIPMHQMVDGRGVHYDSLKLNWIGSVGISNLTFVVMNTAGVKSLDDVLKKSVTMGATGSGSGTYLYANAANRVLGTKFQIITGYKQSIDIDLAMERGEVAGRGGGSYNALLHEHADWIKLKKVAILAQIGHERDTLMPDVPLMQEFAKNDEQKQILRFISGPVQVGRPYIAPPGVPADRLKILRRAFDATMKDTEFRNEAVKLALDIRPMNGEDLTRVVAETINTPATIIDKVKAAIATGSEAKSGKR